MPHLNIMISKPVDADAKNELQKEIANNIDVIPGKNAGNTLICISDACSMFKNLEPMEAAFIDVRLFKESPMDSKKEFAMRLFTIFESVLKLPASNVQINFIEMPCWSSNGNFST